MVAILSIEYNIRSAMVCCLPPSQRKDKIAKNDSFMHGPENGAGTNINNQCSIPDSVEPTTTGECQFVPPSANDI